jgi:ribosomal protein RSM22 (predicted rRNA methylase)
VTTVSRLSARLETVLAQGLDLPLASIAGETAEAVKTLSGLFVSSPSKPLPSYCDERALCRAYSAYYLPVSVAKIQALLAELGAALWSEPSRRTPFRVLDLGCGPGAGALAVAEWISRERPEVVKEGMKGLEIHACDRSALALDYCGRFWRGMCGEFGFAQNVLTLHREDGSRGGLGLLRRLGGEEWYDLILLSNCLNELFRNARDPISKRAELVGRLLERLSPAGTVMLIEPALCETARGLHQVRDRVLHETRCTVFSPCLHELPCPALIKEDDWCHEERPWTPPAWVAEIDRRVGFIKDALKFAYVLLRKDGSTLAGRNPAVFRVVSELRDMKGEQRAWLCNETGRFEVGRLDRAASARNRAFEAWHRGAIVRIDEIVRKERKGREAMVGRIPSSGTVELIRPV